MLLRRRRTPRSTRTDPLFPDTTLFRSLGVLFICGAFGKAVFGGLGERLGVVRTVMVAEAMTASLIVATLFTPLPLTLILLPLLGIVLNGTSSVLYGTVPELSEIGRAHV